MDSGASTIQLVSGQQGESPDASPACAESKAQTPPRTSREFEKALRLLGYTRSQAKAITSHGFKGAALDEMSDDLSELSALIERNTTLIERFEKVIS